MQQTIKKKQLKKIRGVLDEKINLKEVIDYIKTINPESVVYVGGDSQVYSHKGQNWNLYIVIIAIHIDGNKGVRVFKQAEWLRDYSGSMRQRLMTEVMAITDIAGRIMDGIGEKRIQWMIENKKFDIHLDINSKIEHKSNVVMKEAMGYVKGMLGIDPKVKPNSFIASVGADRFTKI